MTEDTQGYLTIICTGHETHPVNDLGGPRTRYHGQDRAPGAPREYPFVCRECKPKPTFVKFTPKQWEAAGAHSIDLPPIGTPNVVDISYVESYIQ